MTRHYNKKLDPNRIGDIDDPDKDPYSKWIPLKTVDTDLSRLDAIQMVINTQGPPPKRTKEQQLKLDEQAMYLRAQNKTYRQIADELGITPSSAHGRVKRHLHRQRLQFNEHLSDIRDFDLFKLELMEPMHISRARRGDPRAFHLMMRSMDMRQRLLKIQNPNSAEEMARKLQIAESLATEFNDAMIEEEEAGLYEKPVVGVQCSVVGDQGPVVSDQPADDSARTTREQTGEHGREQTAQAVEAPDIAQQDNFSADRANTPSNGYQQRDASPAGPSRQDGPTAARTKREQTGEQEREQRAQSESAMDVALNENFSGQRANKEAHSGSLRHESSTEKGAPPKAPMEEQTGVHASQELTGPDAADSVSKPLDTQATGPPH